MAAIRTERSRRQVRHEDRTIEQAYASRASYGAPDRQVEAWVSTYTSIAAGDLAAVSPDGPALTGHPATSLEDFLESAPEPLTG